MSYHPTILSHTTICFRFKVSPRELRRLRDKGVFPEPDATNEAGHRNAQVPFWKISTVKKFFASYKRFSKRPSWKYFTGGPVYIYEVQGGRTWGGDTEDFVSFCLVVTKEKISIKDFTAMFAEVGQSEGIHYGPAFLRDVAKRLCDPDEKYHKKREVPTNRRIEYDGYYWEIRQLGDSDNNGLLFDNARAIPIDWA